MPKTPRVLADIAAINTRYDRACIGLWIVAAILTGLGWSLDAGEMIFSIATLLAVAHRMLHTWVQHRFFPRTASSKVAFWLLAGCVIILLGVLLLCARHYQREHETAQQHPRIYRADALARPLEPNPSRHRLPEPPRTITHPPGAAPDAAPAATPVGCTSASSSCALKCSSNFSKPPPSSASAIADLRDSIRWIFSSIVPTLIIG